MHGRVAILLPVRASIKIKRQKFPKYQFSRYKPGWGHWKSRKCPELVGIRGGINKDTIRGTKGSILAL